MNPIRSALFAMLALGPTAGFAQSMSDSDILNKIHSIDRNEMRAAAMAEKTSTNSQVKKFAERMTKEHGQADEKVIDLAKKKGISLADVTSSPDPLEQMVGVDFDRGYANKMVKGHQEALDFLAKADAQTGDADVKALVEKLQPTVQHHEKMAEKLQSRLAANNPM